MKRILIAIVGSALFSTAAVGEARGQYVWVGPRGSIHVRAPFVAVDVGPRGETRVRAPFVHVHVPGDGDTPDEIRRDLAARARWLDRSLRRFRTGKGWQEYLQLPAQVFTGGAVDVEQLEQALARYAKASRQPRYRVITGLRSFRATHAALSAYVGRLEPPAPPVAPAIEEIPTPRGE